MNNKNKISVVKITNNFLSDLNSWPFWLLESYEKGLKFYKERGVTFKTRYEVLNSMFLTKINDFLLYSPGQGISKFAYSKYLKFKKINDLIESQTKTH